MEQVLRQNSTTELSMCFLVFDSIWLTAPSKTLHLLTKPLEINNAEPSESLLAEFAKKNAPIRPLKTLHNSTTLGKLPWELCFQDDCGMYIRSVNLNNFRIRKIMQLSFEPGEPVRSSGLSSATHVHVSLVNSNESFNMQLQI